MTSKHRHVGCQSRGKRLECWRCVLRFKFGWAYLEKKPQMYLFWPYYWKGQIRVRFGLFLLIHSPKLKSEHTAPTFQPLASGLTPHMPMFGHHEIFTFWWEGKILKWKSTQLTVKNFVKKKLYSISYIWKATKSGSAPIFWRFHLVSPLPTCRWIIKEGRGGGSCEPYKTEWF